MSKYPPISIISPAQFDAGTAQTPGSTRLAAVAPGMGVQTGLWGGIFVVEPGAATGIHHHGEQETIAYVLEGECRVRWGERGEFSASAKAGDFIHVPGWLPHMEPNASHERPFKWGCRTEHGNADRCEPGARLLELISARRSEAPGTAVRAAWSSFELVSPGQKALHD